MAKRLPGILIFLSLVFSESERLLHHAENVAPACESVTHNRIYKQYNKRSVRKPYETSLFRRWQARIMQFFLSFPLCSCWIKAAGNYLRNNIS